MTLQAVQARTEVGDDRDQVDDRLRQQALKLVRLGLPLSAREFAVILRKSISRFHREAARHAFDDFLLVPANGTKRYSGVKVQRWLNGETLDDPVFGRKLREAR